MHAQNWKEPFDEAVARAKDRHQQAVSEAYQTFNAKHAETVRHHRKAYMAAKADWDAIKTTPEADGYEEARQAFLDANAPADHTEARAEMDRAVRAADDTFHAEVARLGREHDGGVETVPRARSRWLRWGDHWGDVVRGNGGPYLQRARSLDSIQGVRRDNIEPDQLFPTNRILTQFFDPDQVIHHKPGQIPSSD